MAGEGQGAIPLVLQTGEIHVVDVVEWRVNPSVPRIVERKPGESIELERPEVRQALARGRGSVELRLSLGCLADEPAIVRTGAGQF